MDARQLHIHDTFSNNGRSQSPLHSVFPMKPEVTSIQDLFEFICSGPLINKLGLTSEMVAKSIDKWLAYGLHLCRLFQLNELYLTIPQKARFYHYYIPVFVWCEQQISHHRSTFKKGEDVTPLVIGFSAPQGCGKTTLVFALDYLFQITGRKSATISIDDFYLIAEDQAKLRESNPGNALVEFRGNAGSHDLSLSVEIYNEQITDLLDPSQRNLQIREDVNSGVYVENLTEECVSTMKDVTQLLMKGLSNRRTGAISINAESSRSHSVFTCAVKSRCKSVADGLNCFKTSRINLVDLVGSERQKQTGAAGECLKEAGNINRSLSQLGNLINILAEVSQSGKQRHIPHRDSRLTFLLQESLGGNAKLAMVCAISPVQSCKSETLSTLRFAQRAKAIKNRAVVNEVMQDDVNFLREVIRQLQMNCFG